MALHVYKTPTKAALLLLLSSIASAQHLPSTPDFCAGLFCFEVAPVVSGDVLVKPTISLVVKPGGESRYQISYSEVGSVLITFQPGKSKVCDPIKNRSDLDHFSAFTCITDKKLPRGLLVVTMRGVSKSATVDLCEQALGAIWAFDPQALYIKNSELPGRKLELTLSCT